MISILFPTRKRPQNLERLYESVASTASTPFEIIIYVDSDDKESPPIADKLGIITCIGQRKTLSSCYNDCYSVSSGDILMFAGDDLIFRDKDWDKMVIDTFDQHRDKIIFVHGDDGHWGYSFGTHGFLHKRWCEAVGYVTPPYFPCDWSDTWINEVSNALGRRVVLPILIEHMHPCFNKATWDQTHNERLARSDSGRLFGQLAHLRQQDVQKLQRAIQQRSF